MVNKPITIRPKTWRANTSEGGGPAVLTQAMMANNMQVQTVHYPGEPWGTTMKYNVLRNAYYNPELVGRGPEGPYIPKSDVEETPEVEETPIEAERYSGFDNSLFRYPNYERVADVIIPPVKTQGPIQYPYIPLNEKSIHYGSGNNIIMKLQGLLIMGGVIIFSLMIGNIIWQKLKEKKEDN